MSGPPDQVASPFRSFWMDGREHLQVLWTLMHYGLPQDLSLRDDRFIPRFARFAAAAARALLPLCPAPRINTPVNEISFLAWAASATEGMGPAVRPTPVTPATPWRGT